MPVEAKRIWVVADDYGIARGVNAAIRDLLAQGAINATSVMVVASGFDEREVAALTALRAVSGIAVGLHLTLTAPFRPLVADYAPTREGSFLPLGETFVAAALGRMRPDALEAEAAAQIARFVEAFGRPPDYIDGHQHVHLFPRVADAALAAARTGAPGPGSANAGGGCAPDPGRKRWCSTCLARASASELPRPACARIRVLREVTPSARTPISPTCLQAFCRACRTVGSSCATLAWWTQSLPATTRSPTRASVNMHSFKAALTGN